MAHFAELDENNVVLRVIVIANEHIRKGLVESEQLGIDYCKFLTGSNNRWLQTSYNGRFRGTFAGIGYIYVPEDDKFISPKPYPSWEYDFSINDWNSPIPYPEDRGTEESPKYYEWDEANLIWVEFPPYQPDPEDIPT